MALAKNQINFTHRVLDRLSVPGQGKRNTFFDSQVKGLNVVVTDKGVKSFYLRKVVQGQSTRLFIGRYPDLSVENAREQANTFLNQIAKGLNPHDQRQKLKEEPTFAEMFDLFIQRHGKLNKRTYLQDQKTFDNHLKKRFGNKKLSALLRQDFQRMMVDIANEHGQYAANKTLAIARVVLNKAIEWGILHKENPASYVKSYRQKSRERFLQKDELPRFFAALNAEPNADIKDFVSLCLLTGARKSNVMAMRWDNLNLDAGEWLIPITKNGDSQNIPLVPEAIKTLKKRRVNNRAAFVFPSHSAVGHMVEPKKGWAKLLERAEIEDFRIHDLRRTMGSYQAILGVGLNVIGKSLGHKSLAATQIYARMDQDPVRQAMTQAADLMFELGKGSSN